MLRHIQNTQQKSWTALTDALGTENFVNDQMQKMMVLPGACSISAFQEKKTEMKMKRN
jgi:hypothetical protein